MVWRTLEEQRVGRDRAAMSEKWECENRVRASGETNYVFIVKYKNNMTIYKFIIILLWGIYR